MEHAREQTERLAAKLKQIRKDLNLSQGGIIKLPGLEDKLSREDISKFERGVREPPLSVIVKYARAINVSTDILIDDELDLPEPED
jgi:transcriptional regulator with XRE-family HTH domain